MTDTKHCPFCDELIRIKASKCRYCLSVLNGGDQSASEKDPKKQITLVAIAWIITLGVLVFAAVFILLQQRRISNLESARPDLSLVEADGFFTENAFDLDMDMVAVTGGTFTMGCNSEHKIDCFRDEEPSHQVHLSKYFIGRTPVTQRQWRSVMGSDPKELRFSGCDDCPVEMVSWNDVQKFIRKLNQQSGKTYSLPTEAQWEYAARGGQDGVNSKFSGHNIINHAGWFSNNSERKTHPVGGKLRNSIGLYDMSGNVWEWCSDRYGDYNKAKSNNPTGPSSGSHRVVRGGSWSNSERYCRVSARQKEKPNRRMGNIGFRLVLNSSE